MKPEISRENTMVSVFGKVKLYEIDFTAGVVLGSNDGCLRATVADGKMPAPLSLNNLLKRVSPELAALILWNFQVNTLGFVYFFSDSRLLLQIGFRDSMAAVCCKWPNGFTFGLHGDFKMPLSALPLIGNAFDARSGIELSNIGFQYLDGQAGIQVKAILRINGSPYVFQIPEPLADASPLPNNPAQPTAPTAPPTTDEAIKWVVLQKNMKCIHIKRIGFSFKDGAIKLHLDIGFTVSLFSLHFMDLYASLTIGDKFAYSMGLKGLFITFNKPPIAISGGLYMHSFDPPSFSGQAVLTVGTFSLGALATYATLPNGKMSLFIYLMLAYPLGGPAFFFVTGLALGVAVNRGMVLPRLQEVKHYPLVSAVLGLNKKLKSDTDPTAALSALSTVLYPSEGEFVIAAGVMFTTFELLKSFVLVSVSFGVKLEFRILGFSTLAIPKNANHKLVHAELALVGVFSPEDGIISVEGQLTDQSYIFSRNCKLTGGFAFFVWTSGTHKGDFVVSIGGYHPNFQKPAHYPTVNRLGIRWRINPNLSLEGNAYFALTPSCVMAGGALSLYYQAGKLSAWLKMTANFLLQWEPFYYDIDASASIGASYGVFSLELSSTIHLFGPPFSGNITIKWWVISFTISFGENRLSRKPLSWEAFQDAFLPTTDKVCAVNIADGLLRKIDDQAWMVRSQGLCLTVRSFFPSQSVVCTNGVTCNNTNPNLGILPMDTNPLLSTLAVTLSHSKDDDASAIDYIVASTEYEVIPITENVPYAMWGQKPVSRPSADIIPDVLTGVKIKTIEKPYASSSPALPNAYYRLAQLLDKEPICARYAFACLPEIDRASYEDVLEKETIIQTIDTNARPRMLSQLAAAGFDGFDPEQMAHFKAHVPDMYDAPPRLVHFI